MSRRKPQKRKSSADDSVLSKFNNEIAGILLFALGILMTLGFYFPNSIGPVGNILKSIFFGLFGITAIIAPILMIAIGVYSIFANHLRIFKDNSKLIKQKIIYLSILLVLASALFSAAFYNPEVHVNATKVQFLDYFINSGIKLQSGGLFGGLISIPLLLTLKALGTVIVLTALAIVDVILLTKFSIAKTAITLKDGISEKYKELRENGNGEVIDDNTGYKDNLIEFKPKRKIIDLNLNRADEKLAEIDDKFRNTMIDIQSGKEPEFNDFRENGEEKGIKAKGKAGEGELEIPSVISQDDSYYEFPPIDLLNGGPNGDKNVKMAKNSAFDNAKKLEETLRSFGVEAKVVNISRGPTVTRFELQPMPGVKVSKIVNLADDISLNFAAAGVRIEAPIPGKAAIGIEVPNSTITSVPLKEVIESQAFGAFASKLAFAVGKDITGESVIADIAKMPHLLISGATGSGKSVCINSLIISLLYKSSPEEVKLLMIDPKVVELGSYNGIPHLLIPVVTDPKKASGALNWAVIEMVNRYKLFAEKGVRDIKGYNTALRKAGEEGILPQIVIIIDELADLMMVAPNEVEDAICRLAQMARAAGMHLVIATQRPSVDVITGIIKANIPSRISFAVSSQIDSRTILDTGGAEKLLGRGDMLFYPVGEPKPIRIQGSFVSDKEVEKVVGFIKKQGESEYDETILERINSGEKAGVKDDDDADELLPKAIEIVVEAGQASASLLQRKFKVGYARAARMIDQMEERKIVGPFEGSKPRQVMITKLQLQEMQMREMDEVEITEE